MLTQKPMQQPVQELQCTDHKPACTRTIGGKHAAALQKHFYPEICRPEKRVPPGLAWSDPLRFGPLCRPSDEDLDRASALAEELALWPGSSLDGIGMLDGSTTFYTIWHRTAFLTAIKMFPDQPSFQEPRQAEHAAANLFIMSAG
ncbi:hypothetical protein WJX74_005401 [Apatococcus lobatus]|uniref:Uncharacterized protein n=1 Tax=Apatococcus lobatus TaxID=904363 RepID=A0AAW1Q662_9CHLO